MCVGILTACTMLMPLVLAEKRRGCQVPWDWSYGQLWATKWMLEIKPESFGRAASVPFTIKPSLPAEI